MTLPRPAALLRHRAPALLLGAVESFAGPSLTCMARGRGPWRWPEMLEGAAQAAGLLAGLQPGGLANTAVIAEYRSVRIHVPRHTGLVRFDARLGRRILHFWRCRFEALDLAGTLLLEGTVTFAPGPPRTS